MATKTQHPDETQPIWESLQGVKDPEIPVVSVVDLGMIRAVRIDNGQVHIDISPTYSGCPAMDVIPILVRQAVEEAGYSDVRVQNVLSPPWTTDWISAEGKARLRAFGIAPPIGRTTDLDDDLEERNIPCPQCGSTNTTLVSRFGSTPCKAAFKCEACLEPFDYFKCH
jgi:ring-1,2-phenylacetyl-CoA epoxidase subunit PaaD